MSFYLELQIVITLNGMMAVKQSRRSNTACALLHAQSNRMGIAFACLTVASHDSQTLVHRQKQPAAVEAKTYRC